MNVKVATHTYEWSSILHNPMKYKAVLVLAGAELLFFIIPGMRLCFGFVLETVDNSGIFSLSLSSTYTAPRPFLFLSPPHQCVVRGTQEVGRGHSLDSWPQLTKGIPHMMLCSPYKSGGRRNGECWESWHLSSVTHDGALLSWSWLTTCLPMGNSELIPWFTLLVCTASALLIKLSLS